MRALKFALIIGVAAMTLPAGPAMAAEACACDAQDNTAKSAADRQFETIYTAEYEWRTGQMAPDEDSGSDAGAGLPDVGPEKQAEKLARWTDTIKALDALDKDALSPENKVNYAVYRQQVESLLAAQQYREYEKPMTADTSFWGDIGYWTRGDFNTAADYENYIAMMKQIPRYFDQQIVNMRAGLKRGFTPPRITLQGRDSEIAAVVDAPSAEESPLYAPFAKMSDAVPAAKQDELRAQARAAIKQAVVPAYSRLLTFMRDDYLPHARTSLAAYDLPDGKAYYRSKIREFVTRDMSADEIHQIGLDEVAKIKARMQNVMQEVGFEGTLPEFNTFLRTDPQFYVTKPQDLLDRAAWIAKMFDGKASQYFGHLPRSRFAIKPVPASIAPYYTGGRGGPGIYLVNTYDLPSRPLYSLPALTLHESAPGHAFQMPLAAENTKLPAFRRDTYLSAYGEGWAVYSEKLGEEMGIYQTPYELYGMLSYQMWRAARLVVDTGIHAKGWTRKQAQQYLLENTALSEHEVTTEVDRYIAWPGQALSYYMGELAIVQERARAEKALGEKFNIRAFHDAVLELGSVPLPVITQRVDQLIADGGVGPYPDEE
ncbi:DUF885 family protein [Altericroceibacterium spongiae]|uniref:DUF885 family protein n=1 Tax=Altericroceibacterium spongiae TaxID=2320269 RepID=A0A420EE20_9SPHN|nr:DUF885 family protein [Altericroceibacterium spongiae]RKF18918.1 DUF885 family protein [Altericroceibacterium spongiae]